MQLLPHCPFLPFSPPPFLPPPSLPLPFQGFSTHRLWSMSSHVGLAFLVLSCFVPYPFFALIWVCFSLLPPTSGTCMYSCLCVNVYTRGGQIQLDVLTPLADQQTPGNRPLLLVSVSPVLRTLGIKQHPTVCDLSVSGLYHRVIFLVHPCRGICQLLMPLHVHRSTRQPAG